MNTKNVIEIPVNKESLKNAQDYLQKYIEEHSNIDSIESLQCLLEDYGVKCQSEMLYAFFKNFPQKIIDFILDTIALNKKKETSNSINAISNIKINEILDYMTKRKPVVGPQVRPDSIHLSYENEKLILDPSSIIFINLQNDIP